jgi:hypothetical protein
MRPVHPPSLLCCRLSPVATNDGRRAGATTPPMDRAVLAKPAALRHARAMKFALAYEHGITWIVRQCPAPDKFAHTYAGLIIWLLAALLLKRPRGSLLPLLVVIAAEVGNECVDRVANGTWMWRDTLGDMAATWFWPVVLTMALRQTTVFQARRR